MMFSFPSIDKRSDPASQYDTKSLTKVDWYCKDIVSLLVEVIDNRKSGVEPDLEQCQLGSMVWRDMEEFSEYIIEVHNEAGVYAITMSGFFESMRGLRTGLYNYKGMEHYKEVFTQDTIERVERCSDFEALRSAVLTLKTEMQV